MDAKNGFNELNRLGMLWKVRHLWPKGSRFAFNCYKRQSRLFLRDHRDNTCRILRSREGVTQGDPLSMVLFGVTMTPLGKHLQRLHPQVLQPWYADDLALQGKASQVYHVLRKVRDLGPDKGFYVEPTKSILICLAQH